MFGADDRVGTVDTIYDGVYNKQWVIYTINGNIYQLFPLQNLTYQNMYDICIYIYNTVLPNLRRSGLNIITGDLVTSSAYNDICSKTGKTSAAIAGNGAFWLSDGDRMKGGHYSVHNGYITVYSDAAVHYRSDEFDWGVRPLITVVR